MSLEVGKTYVFKSDEDRDEYLLSSLNKMYFDECYDEGYNITRLFYGIHGMTDGRLTISDTEIKHFKLKEENKMLKPDDKISIEMTALDGMLLKSLLGKSPAATKVHSKLESVLSNRIPCPDRLVRVDMSYDDMRDWCISQFRNLNQDRIDKLEKKINDAAAELARMQGE